MCSFTSFLYSLIITKIAYNKIASIDLKLSFLVLLETERQADMTKQIVPSVANTMISDRFEVFLVDDFVSEENTLYHYHDFYEIHCTLEGEGVFYVDNHEYHLRPGTVTLISPNDLHRVLSQKTESFRRCYIFVTPQYLQSHSTSRSDLAEAFRFLGSGHNRFLQLDPNELESLLAPLNQEPGTAYGEDLEYEVHLLRFLIFLNRLSQKQEHSLVSPSTNSPNNKDALIPQVIDYINENLDASLTLDSLAEKFYTNKYSLSRSFKKASGINLHSFILKKRLLYSKQLLRKYRSSTEVYSLCGFQSYTHFLRAFKEEFHITPKEFLKRESQNQVVLFDHYENVD